MSAPTDRWLALGGRWLRRAAATLAGLTLDAVVDSLGVGRRAIAWIAHAVNARTSAVATLAVVVVVGGGVALWRYRRAVVVAPATLTRHSTSCASCRCRTDMDHCAPPSSRGGPAAV